MRYASAAAGVAGLAVLATFGPAVAAQGATTRVVVSTRLASQPSSTPTHGADVHQHGGATSHQMPDGSTMSGDVPVDVQPTGAAQPSAPPHDTGSVPGADHSGHGSSESSSHAATAGERPRGLVLGSFAAVNGAALAAAAFLRHRGGVAPAGRLS